ncbi:MAG: hypothetical protein VX453_03155 [Acidobacteriota bacterium]|nr:hypothetical protein [Acidobacteriota bacterium]
MDKPIASSGPLCHGSHKPFPPEGPSLADYAALGDTSAPLCSNYTVSQPGVFTRTAPLPPYRQEHAVRQRRIVVDALLL